MTMAEGSSSIIGGAKHAPLKRSLFNKPAWSKPQANLDSSDLFKRSNTTYIGVATEEELKCKKYEARKLQERACTSHTQEREQKKRRFSGRSKSGGKESVNNEGESRGMMEAEGSVTPIKAWPSPKSLTKRYEDGIIAGREAENKKQRPLLSNVIDLEGDGSSSAEANDDHDLEITTIPQSKPGVYDDFPASDEEFPELARKARERARTKRLQADFGARNTPDLRPLTTGVDPVISADPLELPASPSPPPDPVVSFMITSRIVGAKSLIVNRKLSQRLREVRKAWCNRQKFTLEFSESVILTWRGKRLFDVTSCKSMGIGVDADGNIVSKGEKDIFGEENRQIHIEAMTEEMLEAERKAIERVREEEAGKNDDEINEPLPEQQKPAAQIRLILQAKDFAQFKLIVKPVSVFANIPQLPQTKLMDYRQLQYHV